MPRKGAGPAVAGAAAGPTFAVIAVSGVRYSVLSAAFSPGRAATATQRMRDGRRMERPSARGGVIRERV